MNKGVAALIYFQKYVGDTLFFLDFKMYPRK